MNLADAWAFIRASNCQFYVYVLRRQSGEPFYVGKGSGDRILMHERRAASNKYDGRLLRVIRAILRTADAIQYEVAGVFAHEHEAFAEERSIIKRYGRFDLGLGPLVNFTDGGEGGCNPSATTIKKRAKKLRAVMKDPDYKAAAVACLRSREDVRRANASAAVKEPEYRAACSERFTRQWQDPTFREKTVAASRAAQDLVWKAKHAEGIARAYADPEVRARRKAAFSSERVRAILSAAGNTPEELTRKRASAVAQRAAGEEVRQRVLLLARAIGCDKVLPRPTCGIATWRRLEIELFVEGLL